ncbi:hypothetical protein KR038_008226, partial [Drosophila bunnanda]
SSRRLGLHMKPRRKYSQTIVKSFHISGVAIDEGESAKLYVTNETEKFIVATVSKAIPQAPLDLNFSKGDQITFNTEGDATVSLLGYLHDVDSEDEDDEDYTIENLIKDSAKQKKNGKKAGAQADDEDEEDDDDEDGEEEEEEDDDDSRLIEEYESLLENGDEDDDDDDEDESGEEDSDSDDEEEVEQPKAKVAKLSPEANTKKGAKEQNGVAKKDKEAKAPQNQKTKPEGKKEQPKGKDQASKQQQSSGERTITGGVKVFDVITGKGDEAKPGKRVSVYYIGRLQSNNKTFDSLLKGKGFKFALGGGEVIKGWDVGVAGMKVGGKRRITCPAHMAYGGRGSPPTIPPNSTLVFEVELKAVH